MFREHSLGEHPEPELLERFMLNRVDSEERRHIVRHLVRGCPQCAAVTRQIWALGDLPLDLPLDDLAGLLMMIDLEEDFDMAEDREPTEGEDLEALELARLAPEVEDAARLYAELEACPRPSRLVRVRMDSRFHTLAVCDRLLVESRQAAASDPSRGVELAELAVAVADHLDPRRYGVATVRSAWTQAWAWFGDARRRVGDLDGAERSLSMALHLLQETVGDSRDAAEVFCLQASLLRDLGRPDEAYPFLDQALAVYESLGNRRLQGRVLTQQGILRADAGAAEASLELLRKGADLLDPARDRDALKQALSVLLPLLIQAGRGEEGLAVASRLRALYDEENDRQELARLRRLEGKAAEQAGQLEQAEEAYRDARQRCLDADQGIDAALALFDLGLFYIRQGRQEDFRRLSLDLHAHFEASDIGSGESAALMIFRQHCETGVPRPELLAEVERYIEGAPRPRLALPVVD